MRILAIADEESKYLWDYYEPEKLRGYDLIVGCGDLNIHYLTFLATMAPVPVIYVHGNHDASYDMYPPTGAICIDDDVFTYKGYRFLGLGGSCRYRTGAWQFTEGAAGGRGGCLCHPCAGARLRRPERPAAPRFHGLSGGAQHL